MITVPSVAAAKAAKARALKHAQLKLEAHFDEEEDEEPPAPECEAGKRREKRLALSSATERLAAAQAHKDHLSVHKQSAVAL